MCVCMIVCNPTEYICTLHWLYIICHRLPRKNISSLAHLYGTAMVGFLLPVDICIWETVIRTVMSGLCSGMGMDRCSSGWAMAGSVDGRQGLMDGKQYLDGSKFAGSVYPPPRPHTHPHTHSTNLIHLHGSILFWPPHGPQRGLHLSSVQGVWFAIFPGQGLEVAPGPHFTA